MFKVRDVAGLLNVPTVEIHKKLIGLKQEIKDHVYNEKGITLIDDEGVQMIQRSFLREEVLTKGSEESNTSDSDFKFSSGAETMTSAPKYELAQEKTQGEDNASLFANEQAVFELQNPFLGLRESSVLANDIVEKNDVEVKRSYEINALKSEINKLDTEIYKTNQMMQDYIDQLGQRSEELERLLKERLY